jgi:hypothetical protein
MNEDEVRTLVRAVLSRRSEWPGVGSTRPIGAIAIERHASHLLLPLAAGADGDGACLIEPTVRCNHCGYCLSLGH